MNTSTDDNTAFDEFVEPPADHTDDIFNRAEASRSAKAIGKLNFSKKKGNSTRTTPL